MSEDRSPSLGEMYTSVANPPQPPKPKRDFTPLLSILFELAGFSALIWGFYLIFPCLGFIVGGLAALYIGVGIDPPVRKRRKEE